MKKIFIIALLCAMANNVKAQTDIPQPTQSGPLGGGSWLRFTSGGTTTSIQEAWGINLIGDYSHPVKVYNASFLLGYTSAGENFGTNNLLVSGNVGIGTTSPFQKLDINGGIGFANNNSTDKKLYSPADGDLEWMTHNAAGVHGFAVSHQGTKMVYLNTNGNSYFNGGNVGIGTSTPGAKLDVEGGIALVNSDMLAGLGGQVTISNNYGNQDGSVRLNLNNGGAVSWIKGIVTGPNTNTGSAMVFGVPSNTSDGIERMRITSSGNVGIGTTDNANFQLASSNYKLAVGGNVIAEQVTVKLQTNWPDYVFKPTYTLTPLSELKAYIDQNHHLPEIPSEKEVAEKGLNLGEMNKLLTKKVEELTLYLIEKDKETTELKAEMKKQAEAMKNMESKLEALAASAEIKRDNTNSKE